MCAFKEVNGVMKAHFQQYTILSNVYIHAIVQDIAFFRFIFTNIGGHKYQNL